MFAAAAQTPNSPSLMVAHQPVDECHPHLTELVGQAARSLTGDELERHIASCGYLMLQAYARYEASNCLGDRGEAGRWKLLMQEGIKSRSAAQVARLEQERGLA